jgi:hypothetical protein
VLSATVCTAVGYFYNSSSGVDPTSTLRWNGTSWSIQPFPNPAGATGSGLVGVSCTSSTACTAVGAFYNSAGVPVTLAERWNGTSWSIQPNPAPAGEKESQLNSVSCPSTTNCATVGYSTGLSLDFVPELRLLPERYW